MPMQNQQKATIRYDAPEAFTGQAAPASDVYSAAVSAVELLSLVKPWNEFCDRGWPALVETKLTHHKETWSTSCISQDVREQIPRVIAALDTCLQYDAAQRLPTRELLQVVETALTTVTCSNDADCACAGCQVFVRQDQHRRAAAVEPFVTASTADAPHGGST